MVPHDAHQPPLSCCCVAWNRCRPLWMACDLVRDVPCLMWARCIPVAFGVGIGTRAPVRACMCVWGGGWRALPCGPPPAEILLARIKALLAIKASNEQLLAQKCAAANKPEECNNAANGSITPANGSAAAANDDNDGGDGSNEASEDEGQGATAAYDPVAALEGVSARVPDVDDVFGARGYEMVKSSPRSTRNGAGCDEDVHMDPVSLERLCV